MEKVKVAIFQKGKVGTPSCGDSYFYTETDNKFICAVADGLGSGEFAKESSQIVMEVIKHNLDLPEKQLFRICNQNLMGRRGAVVGILRLDLMTENFTFSSIGNIGLLIITNNKKKKRNIPNRGYLAGYERPFSVMKGKFTKHTNFIMFSDGVEESELSSHVFLYEDVQEIVETFNYVNNSPRADDTTLIAMRYE